MTDPGGSCFIEPTFTKDISAIVSFEATLQTLDPGFVLGLLALGLRNQDPRRFDRSHPLPGQRADLLLLIEQFLLLLLHPRACVKLSVQGGRMRNLGMPELLGILGVAVLLFGGQTLP